MPRDPLDPRWVRRHNIVAYTGMAVSAALFAALVVAVVLSGLADH